MADVILHFKAIIKQDIGLGTITKEVVEDNIQLYVSTDYHGSPFDLKRFRVEILKQLGVTFDESGEPENADHIHIIIKNIMRNER